MKLCNWILILFISLTFLSSMGIASANDCVIREWGLARDVSNMKPVGLAQKFSSKEVSQVFVFASLNCLAVPDAVLVKFDRDGKTVHEKQIVIMPASNYRIWTSVVALPGSYRVTFEMNGSLLNADEFIVEP